MPLKIRLQPEQDLMVNGSGVIRNVSSKPIDLLVVGDRLCAQSSNYQPLAKGTKDVHSKKGTTA